MHRAARLMLVAAILVHLSFLVSWRTGLWNPLFFDATVTHGQRGWDFYALYQAGHNVLTGYSVYESDGLKIDMVIPGGTYTPFRYLPVVAYTLGVLFNLVPPIWAYRLWVATVEVVLLLCAALTWRFTADRDRRARLTAMWLCYSPFYLELYMGQFSLVQGALVFAMLLCALCDRFDVRFDLAWGSSVLWKQNTALLAPLMARLGRWRALMLTALAVMLTCGPYFVLYPGSWQAFGRNFAGEPPWFQFGNLGFRQLAFDAIWALGDTWHIEVPPGVHVVVQWGIALGFLCFSLALTLLARRIDAVLHIALWITTFFLVYHHVWEHHYVMLLPVLVALLMRRESLPVWAVYLFLALPTPFYLIDPRGQVAVFDAMRWTPIRPLWQDLAYHASKALPALVLYLWLAVQIARPVVDEWRAGRFYLWPLWGDRR